MKFIIVETTFPNSSAGKKSAKKLAEILLQEKLAACIHFVPLESLYVWQKKLENSSELLLRIKSKKSNYKKISAAIAKNHPYEVPQIFSITLDDCAKNYATWLEENLK
jgi:periplasmic divalent cation tolerance protein